MAQVLLLTRALTPSSAVLPGLELLSHQIKVMSPEPTALITAPNADVILLDGRTELSAVRSLCRLMETTGNTTPIILITTEGGLAAVNHEWALTDVLLDSSSPAEIDARIRLAVGRLQIEQPAFASGEIRAGELVIDETTYSAKLRNKTLDLTFKEFELIKFLAQHPGRVFSREHLLQEVWGFDYFGGTRTVDVHVRRLRAKLGPENENLIGTIRNVGYRFVTSPIADHDSVSTHI
jgi:DNA-binding response OmpR family regulator